MPTQFSPLWMAWQAGDAGDLNRSAGGAISVTRSRTSDLFESGVSVICLRCSRAVQA